MNLNKVFVLGNLTADPIIRALPSGQSVVNFGLATNRIFYNKDRQKQQQTEFHNIVAFGRNAEIAQQYLRKGSMVLIEGRLQTRNWQDSSGNRKYRTEIITERLQLGPRTVSQPTADQPKAGFQTTSPEPSVPNQNQPQKETPQEEIPIIEEGKEDEEPSSTKEPRANLATNSPEDKNQEEIDVSQIPF